MSLRQEFIAQITRDYPQAAAVWNNPDNPVGWDIFTMEQLEVFSRTGSPVASRDQALVMVAIGRDLENERVELERRLLESNRQVLELDYQLPSYIHPANAWQLVRRREGRRSFRQNRIPLVELTEFQLWGIGAGVM